MKLPTTVIGSALLALAAGACSTPPQPIRQNLEKLSPAQSSSETPTTPTFIRVRERSWGELVHEWWIDESGAGSHASAVRDPKDDRKWILTPSRFSVGAKGYQQLADLLKPVEQYIGKEIACDISMTDTPYGDVTWSRDGKVGRVSYRYGCKSSVTEMVFPRLAAADKLVDEWAQAAAGTAAK